MRPRIKRALTLFEMLLVMTLIGVALSSGGFALSKALRKEAFEKAVEQVCFSMRLAQEIMLDLRMDVTLRLMQYPDRLVCTLETQRELPPRFEKALNLKNEIKGIQEVTYNDRPVGHIELSYDSSLGTTPSGKVELKSKHHAKTLYLKGYPSAILQNNDQVTSLNAPYPEEILSLI